VKQLANGAQELDPRAGEWLSRVQARVETLKQNPAPDPTALAALQEELALARALRSEAVLEKRAVAKASTPTDFARTRDHISDLLELQSTRDPAAHELRTKLLAAVDDLEHRSADATLTKADFEPLRKELAQRGGTPPAADKPKPRG
jgi:hypothetical protein